MEPMKSPLRPSSAAFIWSIDNTIFLELPHGELSHTIQVPKTLEGMTKVLSLLAMRSPSSRIGEPGDPTQHHINKKLPKPIDLAKVRRKPKATEDQMDGAKEVLRRFGII